jgi:glycosyltransferase involved in cell wall biosynthesis
VGVVTRYDLETGLVRSNRKRIMTHRLAMPKPQVSLVLPTSKGLRFLRDTIDSVLQQCFWDFELIIVGCGVERGLEDLLRSYTDERIVYAGQDAGGECAAMNIGVRTARGEYVGWVRSGDLLPPKSLMVRVATLDQNRGVDFCHGDIVLIDETGHSARFFPSTDADSLSALRSYYRSIREGGQEGLIHPPTILCRMGLFGLVGYWDEELKHAGDLDWVLRALKAGNLAKVPGILYWQRCHPKSVPGQSFATEVQTRKALHSILHRHAPDPMKPADATLLRLLKHAVPPSAP